MIAAIVASPVNVNTGAWLDDAPGTALATCAAQLANVDYDPYCRQLKDSPTLFSPARMSDGAWSDNAPGTSLDVCVQQI